jgi:putative addiction module component (TIGR02574 family)
MALTIEQIREAAMNLDPNDRESLADELYASITDEEHDKLEAAWISEIERREADLAAGRVQAVPVDEAIDRLLKKVQK